MTELTLANYYVRQYKLHWDNELKGFYISTYTGRKYMPEPKRLEKGTILYPTPINTKAIKCHQIYKTTTIVGIDRNNRFSKLRIKNISIFSYWSPYRVGDIIDSPILINYMIEL
jgi:hypothetical protein